MSDGSKIRVEVNTGRSLVIDDVIFRCLSAGDWTATVDDKNVRLLSGRRGWTWGFIGEPLTDRTLYPNRREAAVAAVTHVRSK